MARRTFSDKDVFALVKTAKENPWHMFSGEELGAILGISAEAVSAMRNVGAPFIFDRTTPTILTLWMQANFEKVPKLSTK